MAFDPTDLIGSALSTAGSIATNIFNAGEADKARRWSEGLSNTAHQREVADLRAAGLNPILSATKGGGGASTPNTTPVKYENPLQDVTSNFSAAQSGRIARERQQLEQDLLKAQIKNTEANTYKAGEEGNIAANEAVIRSFATNPDFSSYNLRNLGLTGKVLESQEASNRASADLSKYQAQVRSPSELLGKILEATMTGKGNSYDLKALIKSLLFGPSAPSPSPAGTTGNTPRLPAKSRTSAKGTP